MIITIVSFGKFHVVTKTDIPYEYNKKNKGTDMEGAYG